MAFVTNYNLSTLSLCYICKYISYLYNFLYKNIWYICLYTNQKLKIKKNYKKIEEQIFFFSLIIIFF